jgi:hypothetical protein
MLSFMANEASEVAATPWGLLPETSLRRLGRNLPCFLGFVLGDAGWQVEMEFEMVVSKNEAVVVP